MTPVFIKNQTIQKKMEANAKIPLVCPATRQMEEFGIHASKSPTTSCIHKTKV